MFRCLRCPEHATRLIRGLLTSGAVMLLLALEAPSALGCNIPVFRYALERWSSDRLQLHVVVRDSQLDDRDRQIVRQLTQAADSPANLSITTWDLDTDVELPEFLAGSAENAANEPWCVIRSPSGAEPPRSVWSSPLRAVTPELMGRSPARDELVKMLLQGDSAVWLVIDGDDDDQADAVVQMLKSTLRKLEDETPLPDGIGLPGSELYSDVPLMVSFPILQVDADDPAEQVFLEHLRAFLPRSKATSTDAQPTLVVPVFGRGRALAVLTADDIDADTVSDLTTFLTGACSCQVKRLNPGFDLLLSVDWKQQLFGDSDMPDDRDTDIPTDSLTSSETPAIPTLLTIAPGSSATDSIPPLMVVPGNRDDENIAAEDQTSVHQGRRHAAASQGSTRTFVWLTGGFAVFVVLGTIISTLGRSDS